MPEWHCVLRHRGASIPPRTEFWMKFQKCKLLLGSGFLSRKKNQGTNENHLGAIFRNFSNFIFRQNFYDKNIMEKQEFTVPPNWYTRHISCGCVLCFQKCPGQLFDLLMQWKVKLILLRESDLFLFAYNILWILWTFLP